MTPHLWHLYAIFFVLGVVGNGTAQMAYSRAVSSWFERRRGNALAIVMSGGAVGAIVLPPAAEALIHSVGWRQACVGLGALVVVVGVPIVARFIRERPVHHGTAPVLGDATVREGLTSSVFWILVIVLFAQSIAQNGALTHMAALLTDRGVPPSGAVLALSAMGAASLVGRLTTGWLLDRFFAPRVGFCLLSIAALGTYLLAGALVALSRFAIVRAALWLHMDRVRDCGCGRPNPHGACLRCDRVLHRVPHATRPGHVSDRRTDAPDAWLRASLHAASS